jgi:hypothetical protein
VSALAVNDRLTFNDLKALLQTTDGNLSVHARSSRTPNTSRARNRFDGRGPAGRNTVSPPPAGALEKYLVHMEAIIKAVRD